MKNFPLLLKKMYDIYDLGKVIKVLDWDKEVNMPPGGLEGRSQQIATISRLKHELFTSEEFGDLISKSEEEVIGFAYESFEASLIRCLKKSYSKTKKLTVAYINKENDLSSRARPFREETGFGQSI